MLCSAPLGADWRRHDPSDPNAGLPEQVWTPDLSVELQRRLAEELGIEFLDMATAWHEYLGASQVPWRWFHRDEVHGNDRGKQILGRILTAHFSPG